MRTDHTATHEARKSRAYDASEVFTHMKFITVTLVIALTFGTMTMAEATGKGPCSQDRYEVTQDTGRIIRIRKMKALIRCVFTQLGIEGQIVKAYDVARKESGFQPWAIYNAASDPYDCLGLFQHMRQYWRDRALRLPLKFFPGRAHVSALQARANVWAAAVMVKNGGWGAWTTA